MDPDWIRQHISSIYKKMDSIRDELAELEARLVDIEDMTEDVPPADTDLPETGQEDAPAGLEMEYGMEPVTLTEPEIEVHDIETRNIRQDIEIREEEGLEDAAPLDTPADTPGAAVMDIYSDHEAWRTDIPGSELKDIMSAISLNDRALFINSLFSENPELFVSTVSDLNTMSSLDDAVRYIRTHFPDWDMDSDLVYRFMMEVRRKLR